MSRKKLSQPVLVEDGVALQWLAEDTKVRYLVSHTLSLILRANQAR